MKKFLILTLSLAFAFNFALTPVLADNLGGLIDDQLSPVEDLYGGDDASPESLSVAVAEIIRVVIGFLGIIFVVLMVYAGFMWMTSRGNEEAIGKSKRTMAAAVVGTAIILAAYLITSFVIDQLLVATTGEGL